MFGKQDFVIIPKSLYSSLPKFVQSKNGSKVDAISARATKALKAKEVKNISAII